MVNSWLKRQNVFDRCILVLLPICSVTGSGRPFQSVEEMFSVARTLRVS